MPYTKDKNGDSIYVTVAKFKALEAAKAEGREPCAPGQTLCTDGICRDISGLKSYKPGESGNLGGKPKGTRNYKSKIAKDNALTPKEFLHGIVNDETVNLNQRMKAATDSIKYFDPALSSVEVHTDEDLASPFTVTINKGHGKGCECPKCVPVDEDKDK